MVANAHDERAVVSNPSLLIHLSLAGVGIPLAAVPSEHQQKGAAAQCARDQAIGHPQSLSSPESSPLGAVEKWPCNEEGMLSGTVAGDGVMGVKSEQLLTTYP